MQEQPAAIRTLDEWEACKAANPAEAVLLQCGSPVCTRCPAFTECIEGLKTDWKFAHFYVNTHDAEEDLLEELQVTQLPAFLLISPHGTKEAKGQNATPTDIEAAVQTLCAPRFTLDADF
jgi:thiol-disulfide isomerase/thioredoxin